MGEFNVNKSDGSLEQTAGMPSEYPATQVMMSDGVTSVEDKIGNIYYVEKEISNVAVSTQWGSVYISTENVDISGLGFNYAPDIIAVMFDTSAAPTAFCSVSNVSANTVPVSLMRGTSSTVTGKIRVMLKSNG